MTDRAKFSATDEGVAATLQPKGGAAIVAPLSAFPGGVPGNALIVLPINKPSAELTEAMKKGAVAVTPEKMWELLGFNGPAVQVQDQEGRPITIGLEDLLGGLEQHWKEDPNDLNRGRIYAQELMKYGRFEPAEKVLGKVVAKGGGGDDWLALGIAQLQQQEWDKAEGTLKGAQNLLTDSPYPSLHLSKVYRGKGDAKTARLMIERAIQLDVDCVDAWMLFYQQERKDAEEAEVIRSLLELADAEPNKKSAAPFIALQGVYAASEETREEAVKWAEKAVERNSSDPLALVCLSALYGQKGELGKVVELLQKHEATMSNDVRLANNYFEALFQTRQIEKLTKLLNTLASSQNREVKQFAIERSRAVAQFLQQQQQRLVASGQKN